MTKQTPDRIDEILDQFDPFNISHHDFLMLKPEAKAQLQAHIDKVVEEVIGEDTPRVPQEGFTPSFKEAARRTVENQLKARQRQRYKGLTLTQKEEHSGSSKN